MEPSDIWFLWSCLVVPRGAIGCDPSDALALLHRHHQARSSEDGVGQLSQGGFLQDWTGPGIIYLIDFKGMEGVICIDLHVLQCMQVILESPTDGRGMNCQACFQEDPRRTQYISYTSFIHCISLLTSCFSTTRHQLNLPSRRNIVHVHCDPGNISAPEITCSEVLNNRPSD